MRTVSELPDDGTAPPLSLLTDRELAKVLGTSRSSIWRYVSMGLLPPPIKIGGSSFAGAPTKSGRRLRPRQKRATPAARPRDAMHHRDDEDPGARAGATGASKASRKTDDDPRFSAKPPAPRNHR